MADRKDVQKYMIRRSDLVDSLISVLENKVEQSQRYLLDLTVSQFVDKLQLTEDGRVRNTLYNKRLLANIDTVFDRFGKTAGVEIARLIAQGVQSVVNFNGEYYKMFTTQAQLLPISATVKEFVQSWLGLTERGAVKTNGYLDTLIKDTTVKNQIKDFALRSVIGQKGWMESKNELGKIVSGRMSQYYRNFVYDTYSQVDRATGEVYAEKLGLQFAVYEGGIIKTTRKFCRERNGKVFHRTEIEKFDPKVAKPPNYNPFTDLGGYGCRHHLNWIPDALAYIMRPDAKGKFSNSQQPPQEQQQTRPKQPVEQVTASSAQAKAPTTQSEFTEQQAERIQAANREVNSLKTGSEVRSYLKGLFKKLGTGDRDIKINISREIDLADQKTYIKTMIELFEAYDTPSLSKLSAVKLQSGGLSYGFVSRLVAGGDIHEINFGSRYDNSRTDLLTGSGKLRDQFKSKVDREHVKMSTATHEFAHVIASTTERGSKKFFTELKEVRARYYEELNGNIRAGNIEAAGDVYLGKYASTNVDEFWAEAFTEYRLSRSPSKYARIVGELGDKYFKKRFKK